MQAKAKGSAPATNYTKMIGTRRWISAIRNPKSHWQPERHPASCQPSKGKARKSPALGHHALSTTLGAEHCTRYPLPRAAWSLSSVSAAAATSKLMRSGWAQTWCRRASPLPGPARFSTALKVGSSSCHGQERPKERHVTVVR